MTDAPAEVRAPTFGEAFRFWLKLGFINFGGPTGQIAIMHKELVEKRRWISEARFLHALNYCMLLPGPEATQLAIYVGWLLHRTVGGLAAGVLFVLPSVFALLALSWAYAAFGSVPLVAGVFVGLKAVVLAIVAHAVIRIGKRALRSWAMVALAAAAFAALVLGAPFPLVVLGAGLVGLAGWRLAPRAFPAAATAKGGAVLSDAAPPPEHARPSGRRLGLVLAVGSALWLLPLGLLLALPGPSGVFWREGAFFSVAALVTFGGAYAVLSYLAQAAVHQYGWLAAGQMIDGLGLAETTPGPLIMVVAFVGFMAGWNLHGALAPALAGTLGLLVAVYFTFLPSFVFIFLGAPYIEALRGRRGIDAALSAITAAVVGVVLNLALFFGQNVVLSGGTIQWFPAVLAGVAFAAMLAFDLDVIPVVLAGAAAGLAWTLIRG